MIATNVKAVVDAANGKPIIFMPARYDHHRVQTGDGYAAYVAGSTIGAPIGMTTGANTSWWGGSAIGTVPHSLISSYGGNTVLAATKFAEHMDPDVNIVALVDFENDSVRTRSRWRARWATDSGASARHLHARSSTSRCGTRWATSTCAGQSPPGPQGARGARSGRLRADQDRRLRRDERGQDPRVRGAGRPVDSYGVGSALIRGENDFTADVVLTDGRPSAKVGRRYRPSPRLERVA